MFSTDFWKRQINCLNDFETVRYRVAEDTVEEAYKNIRLYNNNFGSWNLSFDNEWHDTESETLTIDHLTWILLGEEGILIEAYVTYQAYFNKSQTQTVQEVYDQYDTVVDTVNENSLTEILAYCAFENNVDSTQTWTQISVLHEGREVDQAWKESIINFAHCVSDGFDKPETRGLPKFLIETKCDINEDISDDMKQLSGIRSVNGSLLEYVKKLSTIEDFEKFNKNFDFSVVEDLANATIRVHDGYIVRREEGSSFHRDLPKEFCVQYLTTNLAKHLYKFPRMDFTEVFFL